MSCPPVLLLIFNRPELTRQVFVRIREARPTQLFVAADGPRADRPGEAERCADARRVVDEVDWPCTVQRLFRDENLGCKKAVSSAIDWFFSHVDAGIILEDDCVPHPTFFRFCAELLARYRDDERVMVISGNNFQKAGWQTPHSYYFSVFNHIWGWATWRRAWQHYDGSLTEWPRLRQTSWLSGLFGSDVAANYWRGIFDMAHAEKIDSWGYAWTYSCWIQNGLAILPAQNLVTNIGFGPDATHTRNATSETANRPVAAAEFPLRHPLVMVRDYVADRYTSEHHFGIRQPRPRWRRAASRLRRAVTHLTHAVSMTVRAECKT